MSRKLCNFHNEGRQTKRQLANKQEIEIKEQLRAKIKNMKSELENKENNLLWVEKSYIEQKSVNSQLITKYTAEIENKNSELESLKAAYENAIFNISQMQSSLKLAERELSKNEETIAVYKSMKEKDSEMNRSIHDECIRLHSINEELKLSNMGLRGEIAQKDDNLLELRGIIMRNSPQTQSFLRKGSENYIRSTSISGFKTDINDYENSTAKKNKARMICFVFVAIFIVICAFFSDEIYIFKQDLKGWNKSRRNPEIQHKQMVEEEKKEKVIIKEEYPEITPEIVLALEEPSAAFLCPLDANTAGIRFGRFKIRNYDTNEVLLEIESGEEGFEYEYDTDDVRTVKYEFPKEFLLLKTVGTTVEFRVGSEALKNFRMIERHYFKNKLMRSYDFAFGFCIPNSTNEWESIYALPPISEDEMKEMIAHPWETKSDSYYFVDNKLIMHHRSEYAYQDTEDDYYQQQLLISTQRTVYFIEKRTESNNKSNYQALQMLLKRSKSEDLNPRSISASRSQSLSRRCSISTSYDDMAKIIDEVQTKLDIALAKTLNLEIKEEKYIAQIDKLESENLETEDKNRKLEIKISKLERKLENDKSTAQKPPKELKSANNTGVIKKRLQSVDLSYLKTKMKIPCKPIYSPYITNSSSEISSINTSLINPATMQSTEDPANTHRHFQTTLFLPNGVSGKSPTGGQNTQNNNISVELMNKNFVQIKKLRSKHNKYFEFMLEKFDYLHDKSERIEDKQYNIFKTLQEQKQLVNNTLERLQNSIEEKTNLWNEIQRVQENYNVCLDEKLAYKNKLDALYSLCLSLSKSDTSLGSPELLNIFKRTIVGEKEEEILGTPENRKNLRGRSISLNNHSPEEGRESLIGMTTDHMQNMSPAFFIHPSAQEEPRGELYGAGNSNKKLLHLTPMNSDQIKTTVTEWPYSSLALKKEVIDQIDGNVQNPFMTDDSIPQIIPFDPTKEPISNSLHGTDREILELQTATKQMNRIVNQLILKHRTSLGSIVYQPQSTPSEEISGRLSMPLSTEEIDSSPPTPRKITGNLPHDSKSKIQGVKLNLQDRLDTLESLNDDYPRNIYGGEIFKESKDKSKLLGKEETLSKKVTQIVDAKHGKKRSHSSFYKKSYGRKLPPSHKRTGSQSSNEYISTNNTHANNIMGNTMMSNMLKPNKDLMTDTLAMEKEAAGHNYLWTVFKATRSPFFMNFRNKKEDDMIV